MTGTFDNWGKSEKLEKSGSAFEKTVTLPQKEDKILYKVRMALPQKAVACDGGEEMLTRLCAVRCRR